MRLAWLIGALTLALALAVVTSQTPRPLPANAPATTFSAARAMVDVREIAQRPHQVGSADHARVRAYLTARMTALGLAPASQSGALSPGSIGALQRMGGDAAAANYQATNLVGVLPGRNPAAPAVLLMAHYDTVPGSPGAADDSTGVAAILEATRAIRARGVAERPLVILLTDAEELGLDGARLFFSEHPLRDRIGAVVNLEARGGGGRATMFETGPGNAETIALYARAAGQAQGGPTSSSLAVFVYRLMPNGTDFTIPRQRGIPGVNLAFVGRPDQYHRASSTPEALDPGSVQHIGAQALETADALLRTQGLPVEREDIVYSDIYGLGIIRHSPGVGWLLLGLAAALTGFAGWRARTHAGLSAVDIGRGALDGLWFVCVALVFTQAVRGLAGPLLQRAESAEAYYGLLARLPWIEAGAALAVLATALALMAGRARIDRRVSAGAIATAAVVATVMLGVDLVILGAAVLAIGLSWAPGLAARTAWGGSLGLIALVGLLALPVQALAPEAAFLLIWPMLLAAGAAAAASLAGPDLLRPKGLIAPALATVIGGGWLLGLSHQAFLGVGVDLPGVLALMGLLVLMLARPLSPERTNVRPMLIAAGIVLILACGLSFAARIAEPIPTVAAL